MDFRTVENIVSQTITLNPGFKVRLTGPVQEMEWSLKRIGEMFMNASGS